MTLFAVTVPELTRSAQTTRGVVADLRGELDLLRRRADAVLTESWLGPAAESFDRAWSDWSTAAGDALAALAVLAEELDAAAAGYRSSDDLGAQALLRAAS